MLTSIDGGLTDDGKGDGFPRTLRIELDPHIEVNGRTYTTLDLSEPTGRMIVNAEAELARGNDVHSLRKFQLALVSQASGLPRAVVENMRITQIEEAFNFLTSFKPNGTRTGET